MGGSAERPPAGVVERVEAEAGAAEALARLAARYRLVVATNADDSPAPDVRLALARVGLDEHIEDVVSSADVGDRKPNYAFYRAALAIGGVAWERAGRVWYDALRDPRLAPDAGFDGDPDLIGDTWRSGGAGETGYTMSENIYVLKLDDGTYAKLTVTMAKAGKVAFDAFHQSDGSRNLVCTMP